VNVLVTIYITILDCLLQNSLLKMFPIEAGKIDESERVIPVLPSKQH